MSSVDLFGLPILEQAATTGATKVVCILDPATPFDVYIGRAIPARGLQESPWANPYKIKTEAERADAVAKFEKHLRNQPTLMHRLRELRGKTLGCWCHPRLCHGHVLARIADSLPDGPMDRLKANLRNRQSFRYVNGPGSRERGPEEWQRWLKQLGLFPAGVESWDQLTDADAIRILSDLEDAQKQAEYIKATRRR